MKNDNRDNTWVWTAGIVQRGHRVASGLGDDSPYPTGTIVMQLPYFQALGLDLRKFFPGTLNVSIAPNHFELLRPEYTFERLQWTDLHPPETFSFSRRHLRFANKCAEGMVYHPHPETKRVHFQDASVIEVLAPRMMGIGYGDRVELALNSREVRLITP